MGYDCTLHLVDESAIRTQFIPRLLNTSDEQTALDRVMENADELLNKVRAALDSSPNNPDIAASLLCQLAVTFAACSLPHQYERGFALSLWQDQAPEVAVEYPSSLTFSPEPLFADVVARYPALHNQFPDFFTGNYSTGAFVPSDRVPEVLAFVEKKVSAFEKGDQRQFKGLLNVLRTAAMRKLAYWEATDLAVPIANQYAGDPKLMMADFLGTDPATPGGRVEEAPLEGNFATLSDHITDDGWLISADYHPFGTWFWDLNTWPPKLAHTVPLYAAYQAHARNDPRWLLFSEANPDAKLRTFRPRVFDDLTQPAVGEYPFMLEDKEQTVRHGGFVAGKPFIFADPPSGAKPEFVLPAPMWLVDGQWVPMPGLPPIEIRPSEYPGFIENPFVGFVNLTDGSEVVIWDGVGYELRGGRFEKTFAMHAHDPESIFTYAPAGSDGFFYLSKRCLFEIHRGGEPIPHGGPRWTNIMHVRSGPAGGILLREGDNKDDDAAKLYFPAERTFIHIAPELFDDREYRFMYFSEKTDRFIVLAGKWLAVMSSTVLSLPRYNPATNRKVGKK